MDNPTLKKTFKLDICRGIFRGILTAGTQTFGLFIAIRYFEATDLSKALIGSAPFIGMFFSILAVHFASKTGWKKSKLGSIPAFLCGVCLFFAAFSETLWGYTLSVALAFIFLNSLIPFLTSIYNDNYPKERRGALFSVPIMMMVIVAVIFGFIGSYMMDHNDQSYRWVLIILAIAGIGKSLSIFSMPTKNLETNQNKNPFSNLKLIFEDRPFGYVLLTWFIMGFANLWILPLRVDYVTSSGYGIEGSAMTVAILITIIPDSMRALAIPIFARLFDKMNFIILRMILNITFGIGIALFFLTDDLYIIGLGSAFIGIAFGGGSIAWGLWVTKYAPPGKVADYMSVHVCLTGIRGTIGPMIGFWAVGIIGPQSIGFISCGLMFLATAMLIPEIKHGNR